MFLSDFTILPECTARSRTTHDVLKKLLDSVNYVNKSLYSNDTMFGSVGQARQVYVIWHLEPNIDVVIYLSLTVTVTSFRHVRHTLAALETSSSMNMRALLMLVILERKTFMMATGVANPAWNAIQSSFIMLPPNSLRRKSWLNSIISRYTTYGQLLAF